MDVEGAVASTQRRSVQIGGCSAAGDGARMGDERSAERRERWSGGVEESMGTGEGEHT